MMAAVVSTGTGTAAEVEGYTVAGKTGTARKPQDTGTYQDAEGHIHYMAAFAGFVPAENPQLSAIVVLDDPTKSIFAAQAAAPVFSRIMSYALRLYKIPPPGVALTLTPPSAAVTGDDEVTGQNLPNEKPAPDKLARAEVTPGSTVPPEGAQRPSGGVPDSGSSTTTSAPPGGKSAPGTGGTGSTGGKGSTGSGKTSGGTKATTPPGGSPR
jgi:membrane peptidoglycan carboxypeptidase